MLKTALFTIGPHWKFSWCPLAGKWINQSQYIYPVQHVCVCACVRSAAELYPTLCDPMDCSLPGSFIVGIFLARILGWVTISFSRGIFQTQGLNPSLLYLLHWQRDSLPLCHLGTPWLSWLSPKTNKNQTNMIKFLIKSSAYFSNSADFEVNFTGK